MHYKSRTAVICIKKSISGQIVNNNSRVSLPNALEKSRRTRITPSSVSDALIRQSFQIIGSKCSKSVAALTSATESGGLNEVRAQ
ncbi:hypothetical protein QE152_g5735 [Popillia japonica]|uniref:Ribosomal protein S7 n=1 Tax=Popillia japonica TaxID=7064 RepID=A0AAW1MKU1_POPJA